MPSSSEFSLTGKLWKNPSKMFGHEILGGTADATEDASLLLLELDVEDPTSDMLGEKTKQNTASRCRNALF